MANGPGLSTRQGGIIPAGPIRDCFLLLDVLYANQFEGESFDEALVRQTEETFYRGAPPNWLNFYISEQEDLGGTPIIKRDGCETLKENIRQSKKTTSTVKLFHEQGCGGTTLAMQVLWDLRKQFRCAVLTDNLRVSEITPQITDLAVEVVRLFTAGNRDNQNTVLLLLNDEQTLENLQDSIMAKLAEQQIKNHMPVAILLCCVRKETVKEDNNVVLKKNLSETERQQFTEKKTELSSRYPNKHEKFHGFNIMQTNLPEDYVNDACEIFLEIRSAHKPRKTQLASFLSLLNTYVPDSYLLESQCLDFLKNKHNTHGDLTLEDQMGDFSHLIITYQQEKSDKRVCMAHPMIAQRCTEVMAAEGVTRSDTAKNFLYSLCQEEVPPFLGGFVKDMLTKREKIIKKIQTKKAEEKQDRFSKLIQHIIEDTNDTKESASLLKVASKNFDNNPFFPQALARLYYIELMHYNLAEMWAKRAKERDPQNSFVADTLGQVHKNHLKSKKLFPATAREILQLAKKATDAFKNEEELAEKEQDTDMRGDGNKKVSHVFNNRGQFGYLQVCNLVYYLLVRQNETWRRVLTNNEPLCPVLASLGDNKVYRFNDLIEGLRREVKERCEFLDAYLTYSKPSKNRDDPSYIYGDVRTCYRNYVIDSPQGQEQEETNTDFIQKLKESLSNNCAGVLSCFDRAYSESELEEITTWWKETRQPKDSTALGNYIFALILLINRGAEIPSACRSLTAFNHKMPLSPKDAPELHMLALLLNWPTDSEDNAAFIKELNEGMRCSYEHTYKKYLRSRYLHPLFFIGKGKDLNRIVHRKVLEELPLRQNEETEEDNNWSNEKIFEAPEVQERLLTVEGRVQNYRVYANIGGKEIEVDANLRNSHWASRTVTFYLGFTIRGPVAFGIKKKTEMEVDSSEPGKIQPQRSLSTATTGASGQHFVDRHQTALINRVSDTEVILHKLKDRGFISKEQCDEVGALETSPVQMTRILHCLTSVRGKDALYEILKEVKSMRPLVRELEEPEM